jgi:farnesol dehydrogenase
MNILITGASGFIGRETVQHFSKLGYHINVLIRNPKNHVFSEPSINVIHGDVTDAKSVENAAKNTDVIIHMAAMSTLWTNRNNLYYEINVGGTKNILDAALKNNSKVIYISTAGVIGPQEGPELVNENHQRTVPFFNDYEKSKAQAENLVKDYYEKYGLPSIILNPTRVFGPGLLSKSNSATIIIKKYIDGTWKFIPGNKDAIGNYVFVEDVVQAILLAVQQNIEGERFIVGGENASWQMFFDKLSKVSGVKNKMYVMPIGLMLTAAHVFDSYSKIFKKPPLITPPWIKRYTYNWGVDISKARKLLGYNPLSLEKGMEKTIRWLQNPVSAEPVEKISV